MRNISHIYSHTAAKELVALHKFSLSLHIFENIKSTTYYSFKNFEKLFTQFQISSLELVPITTQKSWNLISIYVRILSSEIAPRL